MATSFFLGMKSSQLDVSLEFMKNIFAFLRDNNKELNIPNDQLLLKYEFYLIHILNYDFYVFCPYKAMIGFIYKLQNSEIIINKINFITNLNIKEIENEAEKIIDKTFATDAIFIYNYSYIALSSIIFAFQAFNQNKNLGISHFEIIDCLEIRNLIDVDNFFNIIIPKIFDMLNKIPYFSREEIREKKSRTTGFLLKYKEYNEKLEFDRK